MKRVIFIIAIVLSTIVFPIMANANDTTEVNTINPISQKQEVELPWYKSLSYGVDYLGGLFYTGKDLMKYTDFDPLAFANPSNYLYWLNSVEVSAIYLLENKKGIEVGVGYGWANPIEFRLIPVWVGYSKKKLTLRIAYVYSYSHDYYYKGKGYKVSAVFRLNRVLGIGLNFGRVWYTGKTTGNCIYLSLNGISLSIGYNFQLKGGAR